MTKVEELTRALREATAPLEAAVERSGIGCHLEAPELAEHRAALVDLTRRVIAEVGVAKLRERTAEGRALSYAVGLAEVLGPREVSHLVKDATIVYMRTRGFITAAEDLLPSLEEPIHPVADWKVLGDVLVALNDRTLATTARDELIERGRVAANGNGTAVAVLLQKVEATRS